MLKLQDKMRQSDQMREDETRGQRREDKESISRVELIPSRRLFR